MNILEEYNRWVQRQEDMLLVPDPQLVDSNYAARGRVMEDRGGPRRMSEPMSDEEEESDQESLPPMEDKYFPLPRVRSNPQREDDRTWATLNPEPENNAIAIRRLEKFTQNTAARDAVLNIMSTRGNDRGLDPPPIMQDDPLEMVFRLPEQMPLIDGATPVTSQEKQNEAN